MSVRYISALVFVALLAGQATQRMVPVGDVIQQLVKRSTLVEPGSPPFYLRAKIVNADDPAWPFAATMEEEWVSPEKWRRIIQSKSFSQTVIVNAGARYEANDGDFFPPDLEQMADSLVDPLPAFAREEFNKLSLMMPEPDGKPGQLFADTYYNVGGDRQRALLSVQAESRTLSYADLAGWNVGDFVDYRKFHDKLIARKTEGNSVRGEILELRDLGRVDESHFAMPANRPTSEHIETVFVPADEYRRSGVQTPDIQWPAIANGPDSSNVRVDIVTDREGRVRQAYSSDYSKELARAVEEQIRKWTFQPYMAGGARVQVSAVLYFAYKKPGNGSPSARSLFEAAQNLSGRCVEGGKPFHMVASFEAFGPAAVIGKGTYEETWVSLKQWRQEATLGGHKVVHTRDGDLLYRQSDAAYSPLRADEVMEVLQEFWPIWPGTQFDESEWRAAPSAIGSVSLMRVSRGKLDAQGIPSFHAELFFFDPKTGALRAHNRMAETTIYDDFQPFGGKQVARQMATVENGVKILDIHVDRLEDAAPAPVDSFRLAGVEPYDFTDRKWVPPGPPVKKVAPVYPEEARRGGLHPTLHCTAWIDIDGHIRNVEFHGASFPAFERAVRDALAQWEYGPVHGAGVRNPETNLNFAF